MIGKNYSPLQNRVQNIEPLPVETILEYATQIASGLQAAHEKDVTHRDSKSANIMVTDKRQIKIMDFGLAKVRGAAQVTKYRFLIMV